MARQKPDIYSPASRTCIEKADNMWILLSDLFLTSENTKQTYGSCQKGTQKNSFHSLRSTSCSSYSGVQEHDAIVCCYFHCQQLQKSRSIHGKMSLPSIRLELYLVNWLRIFICMGFCIPENHSIKILQLFALLHPGPFLTWSVLCEKVTHRHGMLWVAMG
jgi:hypothetical protein